ncbi:hypothetical protein CBW65_23645 [Tumebacillus avium]|uniref:Uncharacterized protein n=1 Tax=Tumebacillus avium TaxID=1903704 RepID=A0A1Y0IUQ6_9BACL|nr:hypothetical protein CBW65_23645 [Tumebacillus avium]
MHNQFVKLKFAENVVQRTVVDQNDDLLMIVTTKGLHTCSDYGGGEVSLHDRRKHQQPEFILIATLLLNKNEHLSLLIQHTVNTQQKCQPTLHCTCGQDSFIFVEFKGDVCS